MGNPLPLADTRVIEFTHLVTGQAAAPMPERISAWGVYDVFTVKNGEQIFLSAVSDTQWTVFCEVLGGHTAELLCEVGYSQAQIEALAVWARLKQTLASSLNHA